MSKRTPELQSKEPNDESPAPVAVPAQVNPSKQSGNVSRDLVAAAYRAFFGREPENEQVIQEKLNDCKSQQILLEAFITSPEFSHRFANYTSVVRAQYFAKQDRVDVKVSDAKFDRLFSRMKEQWTALGRSEPYWSVLSYDRFRMNSIDENEELFYASGAESDQSIDVFCQRTRVTPPHGTCLELGCGVGRVTPFLARRFDHVVGVDISEGNLEVARSYLQRRGVNNVTLVLLRDLKQLEEIQEFDFFYSILVLQHNPPPVVARMLQIVLKRLRTGGGFLFQVPNQTPGYAFNIDSYLERPNQSDTSYEMHALPMHAVLDIISEAGGRVKEVMLDVLSGGFGSHTFFGTRA